MLTDCFSGTLVLRQTNCQIARYLFLSLLLRPRGVVTIAKPGCLLYLPLAWARGRQLWLPKANMPILCSPFFLSCRAQILFCTLFIFLFFTFFYFPLLWWRIRSHASTCQLFFSLFWKVFLFWLHWVFTILLARKSFCLKSTSSTMSEVHQYCNSVTKVRLASVKVRNDTHSALSSILFICNNVSASWWSDGGIHLYLLRKVYLSAMLLRSRFSASHLPLPSPSRTTVQAVLHTIYELYPDSCPVHACRATQDQRQHTLYCGGSVHAYHAHVAGSGPQATNSPKPNFCNNCLGSDGPENAS